MNLPTCRAKLPTAELTSVTTSTSWPSTSGISATRLAANADRVIVLPLPGTATTPIRPSVYLRTSFCLGRGLNSIAGLHRARFLEDSLNRFQQRAALFVALFAVLAVTQ